MSAARIVPAAFAGSATSAAIDIGEGTVVGLQIPAGYAGTTLKFQGANEEGGTYNDIFYLNGVAVTALTLTSVAENKNITISPEMLAGFRYLKLVSSASETLSVNVMVRNMGR
jgi:hypothetical protein